VVVKETTEAAKETVEVVKETVVVKGDDPEWDNAPDAPAEKDA